MQLRSLTSLALLSLGLAACSTMSMKTPAGVAASQPLTVKGFNGNVQTFKEKELSIGSYAVKNIDRDWDKGSGMGAGLWSRDSKKKAYRYDVVAQGRTLHGECNEQAVTHGVAGFGKTKVTFGCTCKESETTRATVELVDGAGSVKIGDAKSYDLAPTFDSEQGARSSKALGYEFHGVDGEGAVDVTGSGRAWLPANVSEEEALSLACTYGGLFLYRPTDQ